MICPNCGSDNPGDWRFCNACGVGLTQQEESQERADEGQVPDTRSLAELDEAVRELRAEVRQIRTTLDRYGMRLTPDVTLPQRLPAGPPLDASPRPDTTAVAHTGPTARAESPLPQPAQTRGGTPSPPRWQGITMDWEFLLGGNWLARVGVLAVVIGAAFFLKLAFDNEWIGDTGRVVLGIVGGLAFLGAAEYWYRRYPVYAQALAGGGIALLYLSIFASFAFYSMIGLYPATGLLLLVGATSAALALRHESMALAAIGVVGAFVAPFVLGGFAQESKDVVRAGPTMQLMIYVMAVDIGVLALSTFRNWRWLTLIALVGSLASFGSWYGQYGDELSLLTAQGSLTIIFVIFVGATTLFHIVWRRPPQAFDQSLMMINAAAYFGISYGLLWDDFRLWMGGFTLLMALFYGVVAYGVLVRGREHVYLSFMALGIALVFLTIAIPVQLGGPWVSAAWAAEGAVLVWLSLRLSMWQLRAFGVAVFAIFAGWLLIVDTPQAFSASFTPFANQYFPVYLVGIGLTYLTAYLLRRNRASLHEMEQFSFAAFLVGANVLLTLAVPIQVDGAWVAFAWAVEALALTWLGLRLKLRELRLFGLGVFAVMAIRLVGFDTFVDLADYRIVLNYRMLAFGTGIVGLYGAGYLLCRQSDENDEWENRYLAPALVVAANFLSLWVASAEVIASVDSGVFDVSARWAAHVKSLTLSLLWAIYACVVMALGIVRRWRAARIGGLALLMVPIVKLFVFDSFALEQAFRVAAFLGLGAILLIGAFLYQRNQTAIRGFLFDDAESSESG